MEPEVIGHYRLVDLLGEGGMGSVYRARHLERGTEVALKTVRMADVSALLSIQREIRALAALEHPSIVGITDHGEQDGAPWYAMDLLTGQTFGRWLELASLGNATWTRISRPESMASTNWWTRTLESFDMATHENEARGDGSGNPCKPSPPPASDERNDANLNGLPPLYDMARALAYLHGEGLVHGDLKPENLLVQDDGRAVLIDFGLATDVAYAGREKMRSMMVRGGTALYMAPERVNGRRADARADLYAFGCIMYEALTGRTPFECSSLFALMQAHVEEDPLPPSDIVDDVPPVLEDLLLALLAKNPAQRPGYASDVVAALESLIDPRDDDAPSAASYVYRPRFVARRTQLNTLRDHVEALRCGQGNLVLIGGESGVGKTRLVDELRVELGRGGVKVADGTCASPDAPHHRTPFHPLKGLFKHFTAHCNLTGSAAKLLGREGRLLQAFEPDWADLPGISDQSPPGPLPVEAARLRMNVALLRVAQRFSGESPILLLLDDLHWSDEFTMSWLDFIARTRTVHGCRLLILATYREEEVSGSLERLVDACSTEPLRLERLDVDATKALVGSMLAQPEPPKGFVDYLYRQSEGNPFFVAEYLGVAVAEGVLRREGTEWSLVHRTSGAEVEKLELADDVTTWDSLELDVPLDSMGLPAELHALLTGRMERLSDTARELLAVCATLGRELEPELLEQFTGGDPVGALDEAIAADILRLTPEGQLRFAHDKLREVAYERLDHDTRIELHRQAAVALAELGDDRDNLLERAHHWVQAHCPEEAADCFHRAARLAAASHDISEATRALRAYFECVAELDVRPCDLVARLEHASLLIRCNQPAEAAAELDRLIAGAVRLSGAGALEETSVAELVRDSGFTLDDAPSALPKMLLDAARRGVDSPVRGSCEIHNASFEGLVRDVRVWIEAGGAPRSS